MSVSFDETNLVPNAGLLPAAVLAQRIDLVGRSDHRETPFQLPVRQIIGSLIGSGALIVTATPRAALLRVVVAAAAP